MNKFKNISVEAAKELLRADNYLIDIRDKDKLEMVFNENVIDCVIHFAGF